ncbi:asparaginyl-tRNA synthetase [Geobacter metallireducens RCH3]|uniref:Asparagine--tRNA ligase n=1 Tax=Geobacter metallireducens (strain ATCC 53774 / DSM 7210 / GS-15) TaxID=269799 RepID=SYN_GEOMG|nr:asparagine--tRNA ligase [Geobacter metallireducens]Q39SY7.1 RecName: Full=Asparagine--tRNA ligase; AltName: Full=Asparaginyl-tRNA synthetase; Short=AsnRS [Geobacter metallireducens GS-15]ABB32637.1 asparaginyl-tRNA synthetase [Geobacter metallireducens GS-15]EHP87870.1 asparaginyl-tRNA synthetase [Geobacter metallireducens RCH3]
MSARIRIRNALAGEGLGNEIMVKGWVRTIRTGKEVAFLALNDGSCFANLQVVAEPGLATFADVCAIGTGAAVAVRGRLVDSPASGQCYELHADEVAVIGLADESYPLQKKRHSFEYLRSIAHLRPRSNTFGAVFRVRSSVAQAVHRFFAERGFLYVHTPIITTSDCEGAGEMFRVTTLDPAAPPLLEGEVDFSRDFFAAQAGLTVSGQLEGELFAQAFSDIYTFGPTFRAENSNTPRHAAEFWMIEPEMAFADLMADAALAEEFFRYLCRHVLDACGEDMAFFNDHIDKGLIARVEQVANSSFAIMEYGEAIERLKKATVTFEYPVEWGLDLQTEHERYLTEQVVGGPVFVINYPKHIKAFYMRVNDDNKTVAAMDLLVPKVGEIIGGSQREERLPVLEGRMAEVGVNPEGLWWYLDSRRWGSTPHAGFGLGFERLIMYLTGMENIRDVIPFPRTPRHAEF